MAGAHDCNAYCRGATHAEVIRHYASSPTTALHPDAWARMWARDLRRDLGQVVAVDVAPEAERLAGPHSNFIAAYLVTYRS